MQVDIDGGYRWTNNSKEKAVSGEIDQEIDCLRDRLINR